MPAYKDLEKSVPGLRVKYEPYADIYPEEKGLLELINDVRDPDARLP